MNLFKTSLLKIFLGSLILMTLGCSSIKLKGNGNLSKEEVESLKEIQRNSVIHKANFWIAYNKEKPEDRVFSAPPELIDYLVRDNKMWGFSAIPKAYTLGKTEKVIFKKVINEFPNNLRKMMRENMVAVFIVEDLGSSALTDGIKAFPKKSFMVFDRKVFQKKANEWCTWKENTPFKGKNISIKCTIRNPKENGVKEAFQYIFAHELAHVFNRQNKELLPFWDDKLSLIKAEKYPFLRISWKKGEEGLIRNEFESDFKDVKYYVDQGQQLSDHMILPLYKKLSESRFPSLYGVTNVWDDFAESFVIYYHTKVLEKPFSIEISDGKERLSFKSCLQTKKCLEKEKVLESIFTD